mgnify:CR=1 FL=1
MGALTTAHSQFTAHSHYSIWYTLCDKKFVLHNFRVKKTVPKFPVRTLVGFGIYRSFKTPKEDQKEKEDDDKQEKEDARPETFIEREVDEIYAKEAVFSDYLEPL